MPIPIAPTTSARGRVLLLGAASLAALLAGCQRTANGAETDGGPSARGGPARFDGGLERSKSVKVLTSPVEQREMVRSISTTVSAQSEREIDIFPRASGVAMQVLVEEGDRVGEGDVLLQLDDREAAASLAEARVTHREAIDAKRGLELAVTEAEARVRAAVLRHEQSKREYERKTSVGEGLLTRNELDQLALTVETNLADLEAQRVAKERADAALSSQEIAIEKAQLQIERAELNRSFLQLTAPFAGVIAKRNVRLGDLVSSSEAAFVLSDPDHVRAVVLRPQRELGFFRAAETHARLTGAGDGDDGALDIELLPEAIPDETYTGRILFVSPTIESASGQFRVTLGVDQPTGDDDRPAVLPGMLLRIRIVTERHPSALVVPKRALLREGDSHFVFAVRNGAAQRVRVLEGFASDDHVEVIPTDPSNLAAGDDVVVVGNRDLESGDEVDASPWRSVGAPRDEVVDADTDETTDEESDTTVEFGDTRGDTAEGDATEPNPDAGDADVGSSDDATVDGDEAPTGASSSDVD